MLPIRLSFLQTKKQNHQITNNKNRRLSLQLVAGTLLLEVCINGIAPALAAGLASTTHHGEINKPVASNDGCTEALPPNRTANLVKTVSPLVTQNLLLEGCSNKPVALDDCTEALPPSRNATLVKAVSPLPDSQLLEGLKASNSKLLPLAQKPQVPDHAVQTIHQVEIIEGNSVRLNQPLNNQLPNTTSQATQDLCEVGFGDIACEVGDGEVLCEVGGAPPALGGGEVPPILAAGGSGLGLGYLAGLLPLLALFRSESPAKTPPETPPTPPPKTPPETPIGAVPEPSTSLGGVVAMGLGILMKRKYSKSSSKKATKTIN
jgi:hypothetical protein